MTAMMVTEWLTQLYLSVMTLVDAAFQEKPLMRDIRSRRRGFQLAGTPMSDAVISRAAVASENEFATW